MRKRTVLGRVTVIDEWGEIYEPKGKLVEEREVKDDRPVLVKGDDRFVKLHDKATKRIRRLRWKRGKCID